jgi:uncharacterized membrane protein (DUF441 family)
MAAKLGMFVGLLVLIILLAGIFGGDKSVHDFGNALYNATHWLGHWIGKVGHWIGETWSSFFGHDKKSAAASL